MPYIFNHLVLIMNSDFVLCGGQTEFLYVIWNRDVKILQKSGSHLHIQDTRRASKSKFHTKDPQIEQWAHSPKIKSPRRPGDRH